MFKKTKPEFRRPSMQFPHCDQRILHAPGECAYCDGHPDWQDLRVAWGIAFTGWQPEGTELPCPADNARGDNHKKWGGNTPLPPHTHLGGYDSSCPVCKIEGSSRI